MESTVRDVLNFIKENDVKFIRLAFCDLWGNLKNISIMPNQIEKVFKEGIAIDGSALEGFQPIEDSDLFLIPDAKTLDILPWRPSHGRVIRFFCEICSSAHQPYAMDCRTLLKHKMEELHEQGIQIMSGLECEFYLFALDEQKRATLQPFDHGSYLDVFPKDQGEDIRREICLTLEEMGITPESSHHEQGPGQNEIDFRYQDALTSCDQFMTFRWIVKECAYHHQTFVSFDPKPLAEESGSGLHFNLSLRMNHQSAWEMEHAVLLEHFIAGILAHIKEMTLFLNPSPSSYERFGEHEAPMVIGWGHRNRSALIRIPATKKNDMRMEVRSPDPTCNVYLASYLLISAGMLGIKNQLPLPEEARGNLYEQADNGLSVLPLSLEEAIHCAKESTFLKEVLPNPYYQAFLKGKEAITKKWKR